MVMNLGIRESKLKEIVMSLIFMCGLLNVVLPWICCGSQQIKEKQADKNMTFREFKIGDMVFLKLQPYIQSSVASRANHKLVFKYFGPFRVIDKINEVAYKLELPEGSTVFHVSLLRPPCPSFQF